MDKVSPKLFRGALKGAPPASVAPETALGKDLLTFASDLGARIRRGWSRYRYARAIFCDVASEALEACRPHAVLDPTDGLTSLIACGALPEQKEGLALPGRVEKAALTLYADADMFIDLNVWFAVPMTIHDHEYYAAWAPLLGESLEVRYKWKGKHIVGPDMALGSITPTAHRHLRPGDVGTLSPKDDCIHRVWHLDPPSLTLFASTRPADGLRGRTWHDAGIVFPYPLDPTVGLDLAKRLNALQALAWVNPSALPAALSALLPSVDSLGVLHLFSALGQYGVGRDVEEAAVMFTSRRDLHLGEAFAKWCAVEERWAEVNWSARLSVDAALAVALLLTGVSRSHLSHALRDVGWTLSDLANGVREAQEEHAFFAPFPELAFEVLPVLLEKPTDDAVLEFLRGSYGARAVASLEQDIIQLCQSLRTRPLLSPLLGTSAT
jgi:hypothetical protein